MQRHAAIVHEVKSLQEAAFAGDCSRARLKPGEFTGSLPMKLTQAAGLGRATSIELDRHRINTSERTPYLFVQYLG